MSQKGFTLIEFLLAFTLGAIILSIIYGVLFTTIEAKKITDNLVKNDRIQEGLFRTFLTEIGSIPLVKGQRSLVGIMGSGDPRQDRLEFISASPPFYQNQNPMWVHEVGYFVESDSDGKFHLFRREENGTDFNLLGGGLRRKIVENIYSFQVSYYWNEEWLTQWQRFSLPDKIKVEIFLTKEGEENLENLPKFSFLIPLGEERRLP